MNENYRLIYTDEKHYCYENNKNETISFWVESDEKESSEAELYRTRSDGEMRYEEYLANSQWHPFRLFTSYLFDGLLEVITLEEAEKIAEQIGEELVD
jgi:hypothetical protein